MVFDGFRFGQRAPIWKYTGVSTGVQVSNWPGAAVARTMILSIDALQLQLIAFAVHY